MRPPANLAQCSQTDLICVALVSKHFHELASAQLYRTFHIIFPDDDDLAYDSPIDGLAGGLDTFTTSEYNYAQHLRDLSMDTLSAGVKGELSYQSYLYSASCGKFLNTLLYLTLKKAKSLEVFRWNIRVELSRQVYRELHRIPSLKKVHLRMQAGESYYMPPPPLPSLAEHHTPEPGHHWADGPLPPPMPSTLSLPLSPYSTSMVADLHSTLVPPSKQLPKSKSAKRGSSFQEPSTLSGFKGLQSLLVLDIDDLDITTELKACIQNSSSTLKELQLSLSEHLALQARKPPVDSDPDDSDVEDEFMAPHSGNHNDGSGPAKAFRAQEERKVQEAFLGRVFDVVELPPSPGKVICKKSEDQKEPESPKGETPGDDDTGDPHVKFIKSLRVVSDQLMKIVDGPAERTAAHVEVLDMIEKAARKYVTSRQTDADLGQSGDKGEASEAPVEAGATAGGSQDISNNGPWSSTPKDKQMTGADQALENIDMEHVESINDVDFDEQKLDERIQQDSSVLPSPAPTHSVFGKEGRQLSPKALRLMSQVAVYQTELERVKLQLSEISFERDAASGEEAPELSRRVEEHEQSLNDISRKLEKTKIDLSEASAAGESYMPDVADALAGGQDIRNYLRETRGFCLESLSMYLVPVKASVLSRAIDLRSLRQLTLLNVGTQAPIWSLLAKENRAQPLPLRSVFTDNVSDAFLTCMSQLEELNELFMVERSAKTKPESFAPRTTNTMDQIRRVVLTKHMPTLKRLVIKDESTGTNWDANEKTMIYICTRGKQLEELAISLNIQAVVSLTWYYLPSSRLIEPARLYAVLRGSPTAARPSHPAFQE